MVTDSSGRYFSKARRKVGLFLVLLAESDEWHRPWQVCARPVGNGDSGSWQLLWEGYTNTMSPLYLDCELMDTLTAHPYRAGASRCQPTYRRD